MRDPALEALMVDERVRRSLGSSADEVRMSSTALFSRKDPVLAPPVVDRFRSSFCGGLAA